MLFSSLAALGHVSCQLFTVERSLSDFFCWELVEGEGVDRPKGEMVPERKMNFSLVSAHRVSLPWLILKSEAKQCIPTGIKLFCLLRGEATLKYRER